jgi:hypothetical protein
MITPGKVILVMICSFLVGCVFAVESLHVFSVRDAPIVSGRILQRVPIEQYSIPKADFLIQVAGSAAQVHARTPRYLIDLVPDTVRFHYNGDPAREVFLFEEENSPYLILLLFWGCAFALLFALKSRSMRRALRWEP